MEKLFEFLFPEGGPNQLNFNEKTLPDLLKPFAQQIGATRPKVFIGRFGREEKMRIPPALDNCERRAVFHFGPPENYALVSPPVGGKGRGMLMSTIYLTSMGSFSLPPSEANVYEVCVSDKTKQTFQIPIRAPKITEKPDGTKVEEPLESIPTRTKHSIRAPDYLRYTLVIDSYPKKKANRHKNRSYEAKKAKKTAKKAAAAEVPELVPASVEEVPDDVPDLEPNIDSPSTGKGETIELAD